MKSLSIEDGVVEGIAQLGKADTDIKVVEASGGKKTGSGKMFWLNGDIFAGPFNGRVRFDPTIKANKDGADDYIKVTMLVDPEQALAADGVHNELMEALEDEELLRDMKLPENRMSGTISMSGSVTQMESSRAKRSGAGVFLNDKNEPEETAEKLLSLEVDTRVSFLAKLSSVYIDGEGAGYFRFQFYQARFREQQRRHKSLV
jgi:hypothetical protein